MMRLIFSLQVSLATEKGSKPLVSPPLVIEALYSYGVLGSCPRQENYPSLTWACPWLQN